MAFPSGHSHQGAGSHRGCHLGGSENLGPSAVRGGGVDLWIRAAALGRKATVTPWIPVDPCGTIGIFGLFFRPNFQGISLENRP